MTEVAIYVHDLRSSGVVRNALDYARRFARDRATTLVAGYDVGLFRAEAMAGGFELATLADAPGAVPRLTGAVRLRQWLRQARPTVLMSPGNMGHPTCYWATRDLPAVRRVYCISNQIMRDDGVASLVRLRWMTMLAQDATRLVLVGTAHRDVPLFARALAGGRAVEFPNDIDPARAQVLAARPAPHAWLEEPVPVVVTIGRLRPQKNLDLLIEGVGRARGTRRLRLAIIGGGTAAERARLTALAAAAGLGKDFLLAGETDNVFAWLARASVFALTSRWEASSLALLEALTIGAPVVVSRRAGDAAEILEDGHHGLLFDGYDADALAEALLIQTSAQVRRPLGWHGNYREALDNYARLIAGVCAEAARPPEIAFARQGAI